jgi:hypothetical protein
MMAASRSRHDGEAPRRKGRKLTAPQVIRQVKAVWQLTRDSTGRGNISETARVCRVSRKTVKAIIEGTHGSPQENLGRRLAQGERSVPPQLCQDPDCRRLINVLPCRHCKALRGLADLKKLKQLAEGRKSAHPRRRRADAPGQRLLFEHVESEPDPDDGAPLRGGFDLLPAHALRLRRVRQRRKKFPPLSDGEQPF